ncbi:MAG: autotransporter-associated beta strand repeat-containing protein, partial [Methyloligella sp. ZOD6]
MFGGLTEFPAFAGAALLAVILLAGAPALAQSIGGVGGNGGQTGSEAGGTGGDPANPNGSPGDGTQCFKCGGAGGGGGGSGGGPGSGGLGGPTFSQNGGGPGQNGGDGPLGQGGAGGGGGDGGLNLIVTSGPYNNTQLPRPDKGKDGGEGGTALSSPPNNAQAGGGGGGGAGGYGLLVNGAAPITNSGRFLGGAGGNGGNGGNSAGTAGSAGSGGSGGDGGVGVFFAVPGGTLNNSGNILGGLGGEGGGGGLLITTQTSGDPGSGGDGGIGVFGNGVSITNSGTIRGGDGGLPGSAVSPNPGYGGNGGAGIAGSNLTIVNSGTIAGGDGGAPLVAGYGGLGGAGITGSNLTVINSGTISAGTAPSRGTQGGPIDFTGGTNILELRPGSNIVGNVVAFSTADTFRLGGTGSANFAASQLGPSGKYRGFGSFVKTGSGTWILTGAPGQATPWTLEQGILSVSSDSNLGGSSGDLTFDGGTLRVTGTSFTSTARTIVWGARGGSWDIVDANNTFTVSQALSGSGSLTKLGDGTLNLTGANTYTGRTTINGGTLAVNGSITSDVTVQSGGTLAGIGMISAGVVNRGTVAPGNSIGTLTVTGNYVGSGGRLEIESVLAGNASPTDQLVLDGGSARGRTGVQVINLNGPGGVTSGNGIPVVVAQNGATTSASAFSLTGPVAAGPYQYVLRRGSGSPAEAQSWYLASHVQGSGNGRSGGGNGAGGNGGGGGPIPLYRPETSAYAVLPAMA